MALFVETTRSIPGPPADPRLGSREAESRRSRFLCLRPRGRVASVSKTLARSKAGKNRSLCS